MDVCFEAVNQNAVTIAKPTPHVRIPYTKPYKTGDNVVRFIDILLCEIDLNK